MKNINKIKLIIFIVAILCMFITFNYIPMTNLIADSGFDSSYDGGSSGDFKSGSSDGDGFLYFILFATNHPIITLIILILLYISYRQKSNHSNNSSYDSYSFVSRVPSKKIAEYIPDKQKFLEECFKNYEKIQYAWQDFDYDTIKKYTTDEMYNMYKTQLQTLKIKNQKNIMKDIVCDGIEIVDLGNENDKLTVIVQLKVNFYDYIIDENTKEVLRGSNIIKMRNIYELTFVKNLDESKKLDKCPNCGAPIDDSSYTKCNYCNSNIVNQNYNFILAKKQIIQQEN